MIIKYVRSVNSYLKNMNISAYTTINDKVRERWKVLTEEKEFDANPNY